MHCLKQKRGVFSGFSLIEVLIVFVLIGIIGSLLIPKLTETRQEALRQTARQQAKIAENALADWFSTQSTIAEIAQAWGGYFDSDDDGYANTALLRPELAPYLATRSGDTGNVAGGIRFFRTYIDTPEMAQLEGSHFIGSMTQAPGVNHAHIRIYWQKDDPTTTNINERLETAPKIIFFLPSI